MTPTMPSTSWSASRWLATTGSRRRSAVAIWAVEGWACGLLLVMGRFLETHQLGIDGGGDADASGLGDRLGVLLGQHGAPDVGAGALVAERPGPGEAGGQLAQGLLEEHLLEVHGLLPGLGVPGSGFPGHGDLAAA